jgi:Tol biopolymer transport system component
MARTLLGLLVVFLALAGSAPDLAAAGPGVGADDPALRPGGVATVQVTATVPTRARATIAGHRVAAHVARPTVLQRRSPTGWAQIDRSTTRRGGSVTFTLAAPTATTTYRVVAPAHRVRLTRRSGGRPAVRPVTLPRWTGPSRTVTVPPVTAQQPAQQPDHQPTQEPTQDPPQPSVSLVGGLPDDLASLMTDPVVDASGRYVAFSSDTDGLVAGDANGHSDVFLLDTGTGTVDLVSRRPDGSAGNGDSRHPDISADGQHVAFVSQATDLVPGAVSFYLQVYVHDRATGALELITRGPDGAPGDQDSSNPSLSRDGRFVAFDSFAVNLYPVLQYVDQTWNVLRHDRSTGANDLLTFPRDGNWSGVSRMPSISDDGQRVAFWSDSEGLVPEDGNGRADVFLFDHGSRVRRLISRRADGGSLRSGSNPPLISGDGGAVVWSTDASGVVAGDDNDGTDTFHYDVTGRTNTLLSREPSGRSLDAHSNPATVNGDGSAVVLTSTWQTTDAGWGLYLADAATGRLAPLWTTGGTPVTGRTAVIAADGLRVLFITSLPLSAEDTDRTDDLYVWNRPA